MQNAILYVFFSLFYAKIKYAEADVMFASAYFYSD